MMDDDPPPVRDELPGDGGGVPGTCEPAEAPPQGVLQLRGLLEQAQYWECRWPGEGSETARFVGPSDELSGVSGSAVLTSLDWEGADSLDGRNLYFTYSGLRGFYVTSALSSDNPQAIGLYVDPEAVDGTYALRFAIDDGQSSPEVANLGPGLSVPLHVIHVGSGDVQVNLHWDSLADLDLHIYEPSGEHTYYGDTQSLTGGQLDLDSRAACSSSDRGRGNENVFWPDGNAPAGQYRVEVKMWDDCGTYEAGVDTNYRVTVILNRTDITSYSDTVQLDASATPSDDLTVESITFTY